MLSLDQVHLKDKDLDYKVYAITGVIVFNNDIQSCLKKMEEMGINKDDNFVCVHVRDNAYKNDSGRRNQDYNLSVRNSDINLKMSQTHKVFQAINFIQRNRNWAHGFLFAPMAWARYEYSILDALKIAETPTVQLLFPKELDDMDEKSSIFSNFCHSTIIGDPNQIYIDGIDTLKNLT